ncbi:MAG: glycosyltransferase [Patescibacteria group bacterium]
MRPNKNIKKILVIGNLYPDSFPENIAVTLKNMGYLTAVFSLDPFINTSNAYFRILSGYAKRVSPLIENYFSKKLVRKAIDFNPDLIISTEPMIPPNAIIEIKKQTGAATVCWFTDSIANLDRQYILASPYDIIFTKEPFMAEFFEKKLGKNAFYLPEACNPIWHKLTDLNDEEKKHFGCDINITGNMYYYRALILENFMDYNIKIWGPVFPKWLNSTTRKFFQNEYVMKEKKAKAFKAAKINLNLIHYTEIRGVNCRAFEIAGCDGFQIADSKPTMKDLFEIGKEIVVFETLKELKEKVAYYLSHEKERNEIALMGYERAHKDHTYEQRLKTLIKEVNNLQSR